MVEIGDANLLKEATFKLLACVFRC